jgi:hypothetical protein
VLYTKNLLFNNLGTLSDCSGLVNHKPESQYPEITFAGEQTRILHERRKKSGERGGREFSPIPVSGSTSFPLTYYVIPAQAGIQKGEMRQPCVPPRKPEGYKHSTSNNTKTT